MGNCYRADDRQTEKFIKIPAAMFTEPRLRTLSAESRLVYALLLDRLELSQKNGWVNDAGEVYLIYTREEIGEKVGLTPKRAGATVRELTAAGLLREERRGLGRPNLLYPMKLEGETVRSDGAETDTPDGQKAALQKGENVTSRNAETSLLDRPNPPASKTNIIQRDFIKNPSNQTDNSVRAESELETILRGCCLYNFTEPIAQMLEDAVRMLYCKKEITVGKTLLPREQIRRLLRRIDYDVLVDVVETMRENRDDIVNPKGYLYSLILNRVGNDTVQHFFDSPPETLPMNQLFRMTLDANIVPFAYDKG